MQHQGSAFPECHKAIPSFLGSKVARRVSFAGEAASVEGPVKGVGLAMAFGIGFAGIAKDAIGAPKGLFP